MPNVGITLPALCSLLSCSSRALYLRSSQRAPRVLCRLPLLLAGYMWPSQGFNLCLGICAWTPCGTIQTEQIGFWFLTLFVSEFMALTRVATSWLLRVSVVWPVMFVVNGASFFKWNSETLILGTHLNFVVSCILGQVCWERHVLPPCSFSLPALTLPCSPHLGIHCVYVTL